MMKYFLTIATVMMLCCLIKPQTGWAQAPGTPNETILTPVGQFDGNFSEGWMRRWAVLDQDRLPAYENGLFFGREFFLELEGADKGVLRVRFPQGAVGPSIFHQ